MARVIYSEEFRKEAVNLVLNNGYRVTDTTERLGVHPDILLEVG